MGSKHKRLSQLTINDSFVNKMYMLPVRFVLFAVHFLYLFSIVMFFFRIISHSSNFRLSIGRMQ